MSEKVPISPGYAIISRFTYPSREDRSRVQEVAQVDLGPGQGVIFTGSDDNPEEIIRFEQSEAMSAIQQASEKHIQMIAIVDNDTGGLLLTDGTEQNSWGINGTANMPLKVIAANYGKLTFAGVWGETREEAYETLRVLQKMRSEMN